MTDNVATVKQLVDVLGGAQVVSPVGVADFGRCTLKTMWL